ncbi:MAG: hypothetical protein ACOYLQ_09470 [Hyphomicrobiaceae bacterium]
MASLFAALENRLSTACDSQFGEAFEFRPMGAAPGGGRRSVDATRAVRTVTGILTDDPFRSKSLGAEERTATRAAMAKIVLSVDARQFATDQPPRHLDRFVHTASGKTFEIADPPQLDAEQRYALRVILVKQDIA